ncbi:hypothetical protein K469DRAFT_596122, partial [Zopfia rhizophila CBS 207.26]
LDGKPLEDWTPLISPNALISIVATIPKLALLIPVAECLSQAKYIHFKREAHPLSELELFNYASREPFGAL